MCVPTKMIIKYAGTRNKNAGTVAQEKRYTCTERIVNNDL